MHTIKRQNNSEWQVGRMDQTSDGHGNHSNVFTPMFRGMNIHSAIKLCSALNGGDCQITLDMSNNVLQACAVR